MLEPERRQLLTDALRPPAGYALDRAIGTTFTLDLLALVLTPVAFASFDVEAQDGQTAANPIAMLEAVRRYADRITIFYQAGQSKVPAFRPDFAFFEQSVIPVRARHRGGIFHPKVWFIRFLGSAGEVRYRLLCLSRNLTFDRSWDTVFLIDGQPTGQITPLSKPLGAFVRALPTLAISPVQGDRAAVIDALARELETVDWEALGDGMELRAFWPMGHDGVKQWPFPEKSWSRLIVSPFVEPDFIQRFTLRGRKDGIVSRPETLDAVGAAGLANFARRLVLRSDAEPEALDQETVDPSTSVEPSESPELEGLHAKLFVVDDAWWSRIWTGSANATMPAFEQNVEFLVELKARNVTHGVLSLINATSGAVVGFGRLLSEFAPSADPIPKSEEEVARQTLDSLAMSIGSLVFKALATATQDGHFLVQLVGSGDTKRLTSRHSAEIRLGVRPLSQGKGANSQPVIGPEGLSAEWTVSPEGLTAFFVLDLASGEGKSLLETSFLVRADLIGGPPDRLQRILANQMRSRSDVTRLLLLLLGGQEFAFSDLVDVRTGDRLAGLDPQDIGLGSQALLEPLMRTLSRDPRRLDDIGRLVSDLAQTEEGKAWLPEGWLDLWTSVIAARTPELLPS
jgi:hypothetical protein